MRYPSADWKPSPNSTDGRANQRVDAVCLHITEGPLGREFDSAVSWFQNPNSAVSAHFVLSEVGAVAQCVDTDDTAYAQGLGYYAKGARNWPAKWTWQGVGWYTARGKRVEPTWKLIKAPINPNSRIVSIENAGQHGTPRTPAQIAALLALLGWLGGQYPQLLPYTPGKTLIGHFMLDPLDRANCPGPHINLDAIAAAANAQPHGTYIISGLPVYTDSQLTQFSGRRLTFGQKVSIDRVHADQPADYAPSAAHLGDGSGFIDLNGAVKV